MCQDYIPASRGTATSGVFVKASPSSGLTNAFAQLFGSLNPSEVGVDAALPTIVDSYVTIESRSSDPGNRGNFDRTISVRGNDRGWVILGGEGHISVKATEELAYALLAAIGKGQPEPVVMRLFPDEGGDLATVTFDEGTPIGGAANGNSLGWEIYHWLINHDPSAKSALQRLVFVERLLLPAARFDQMVGHLHRNNVDVFERIEGVEIAA